MAQIQQEVRDYHISHYPDEEELLKPFLSGFDVTRASLNLLWALEGALSGLH